jgi:predicted transcriptional regulator
MGKCFVIQPFDSGPFDKRFDDIIEPAIKDANLLAYRVDRDPGVVVPIDEIECGIRESIAVVADISLDNPNIWYEVGYARAADKPMVLICSSKRVIFPFDIQHRNIVKYSTESISDFQEMRAEITKRLIAVVKKSQEIIDNEIRKSRLLELASNLLRTPNKDISMIEEILQEVKDNGSVDYKEIGMRRRLTPATVENITQKTVEYGLIVRKRGVDCLSDKGEEMLNFLSSYLRPYNAH